MVIDRDKSPPSATGSTATLTAEDSFILRQDVICRCLHGNGSRLVLNLLDVLLDILLKVLWDHCHPSVVGDYASCLLLDHCYVLVLAHQEANHNQEITVLLVYFQGILLLCDEQPYGLQSICN